MTLGIGFDLDGTLAPPGEVVSEELAKALLRTVEQGHLIAFVTGSGFRDSLLPRLRPHLFRLAAPSHLERMLLFGDGGASVAQVRKTSSGVIPFLPEKSRTYWQEHTFSPEHLEALESLQRQLEDFCRHWPERDWSQPRLKLASQRCLHIAPVETHSLQGRQQVEEAVHILCRHGFSAKANLWGGRIEVSLSEEELPKSLSALERKISSLLAPFELAKPRFGHRQLWERPSQLLIKPIGSPQLRQHILHLLPQWLESTPLPPTHCFPAGRTAIDILRQGCSKRSAMEHFGRFFSCQKVYFLGDEFLTGNDAPLLDHPHIHPISVALEREDHPQLTWWGGGPHGTLQWLEKLPK